jgi:pyruvate dehydrogenase E2 component (dihydrolipoamide acetyltransferase)
MAELMRVPEVAAGATEAVLLEWLVSEGDGVAVGDVIAVVETEKAQVEVEAETAAVIVKLLVSESSKVDIGSPMAVLGSNDEAASDIESLLAALGVSSEVSNSPAAVRRVILHSEQESPEPGPVSAPQHIEPPAVAEPTDPPATEVSAVAGGRQFISPIARRMLREAGIYAAAIVGTGPAGRVVRRDVETAIADRRAASSAPPQPTPAPPAPATALATGSAEESKPPAVVADAAAAEVIEHSRLRRAVAKRLTSSKQSVPHFYLKRVATVDALLKLRKKLNEGTGLKISVNDFMLRAVARAQMEVPDANVIWSDEAMLRFETADIAVAIASERGLVTPVLRSVELMSLGAISSQVRDFIECANAGKLQQRDIEGGSITVTNLGMYGVDEFSAIINPPHSAILAIGAGKPAAVVTDGHVEVATVMALVLSVDHRAIDGALAAQWMQALVSCLENPYQLLV